MRDRDMSAKQRHFLSSLGDTIQDIPEAWVLYHNPNKSLTLYLAVGCEALYFFGSHSSWCTNNKPKNVLGFCIGDYARTFLQTGHMILIHRHSDRYQLHIPCQWKTGNKMSCRDVRNNYSPVTKLIGKEMYYDIKRTLAHPFYDNDRHIKDYNEHKIRLFREYLEKTYA